MSFRLSMFGGLAFTHASRNLVKAATQRKPLVLLALLARARERGLTRDKLVAYLAPESDTEHGRGAVKQLVYALRRDAGESEVVLGTTTLRLNHRLVTSDVNDFEDLLVAGRLVEAVDLYRGPFLDGVFLAGGGEFDSWVEGERADLATRYCQALQLLATEARQAGDSKAILWWRRLVKEDPLNPHPVLRLMEGLAVAGDLSSALQVGRHHVRAVHEGLAIEPNVEVAEYLDRLSLGRESFDSGQANVGSEAEGSGKAPPTLEEASRALSGGLQRAPVSGEAEQTPRTETRGRLSFLPSLLLSPRVAIWVLAGLALLGVALAARKPSTTRLPPRIAVAPFVNQTRDSSLSLLGWIAADWITLGLLEAKVASVVDQPTLYVQGADQDGRIVDPLVLARANGASLALSGRYYVVGDSVEYSMRIVDVATGVTRRVILPIRIPRDGTAEGYTRLRDVATTTVATLLDTRYEPLTDDHVVAPNPEAYRWFIQGQRYFWTFQLDSAATAFRAALAADSTFLTPVSWLATIFPTQNRCQAQDSMVQALGSRVTGMGEFDRLILLRQAARCRGDAQEMLRLARESVRLRPGSSFAWRILAGYASEAGRNRESLRAFRQIDPISDLGWDRSADKPGYYLKLAHVQHMLGLYSDEFKTLEAFWERGGKRGSESLRDLGAIQVVNRQTDRAMATVMELAEVPADRDMLGPYPGGELLSIAREFAVHGWDSGARAVSEMGLRQLRSASLPDQSEAVQKVTEIRLLVLAGRDRDALRLAEAAVRQRPSDWVVRGEVGLLAARGGDTTRALDIASTLPDTGQIGCEGGGPFMRARILAALGRRAEAVQALTTMIDRRVFGCISARALVHGEPEFLTLYRYQPFHQLMDPEK